MNAWSLDCSEVQSLHVGASGSQWTFMVLPPQNVRIGSVEIQKVPFTTLVGAKKDYRTSNFDGLLTMGLFRQIKLGHNEQPQDRGFVSVLSTRNPSWEQ